MFKATMILISGILLVVLCAVFIYKNLLSQYKMSRNGFITVIILFLIIVALSCSPFIIIGAVGLPETIAYLNSSPNIPKEELEMLTKSISSGIMQMIEFLIIGYSSLVVDLIIVKIIQKRKQIEVDNYANKRWNLK